MLTSMCVCPATIDTPPTHTHPTTPPTPQELHARLEPLLIFTIDGANFLEAHDPKWEVVAAVATRAGKPYLVRV
jgi:hypothetical protein